MISKKNIEILKNIIAIVLVINGIFSIISIINKTKIYNSEFESASLENIIENSNDATHMWNSGSITNERDMVVSLTKFSGNTDRGLIISDTGEIVIDSDIKKGQIKLLIMDENKEVIFFEELNEEGKTINTKPGAYNVILRGKSFSGKIFVTGE